MKNVMKSIIKILKVVGFILLTIPLILFCIFIVQTFAPLPWYNANGAMIILGGVYGIAFIESCLGICYCCYKVYCLIQTGDKK